MNVLIVGINTKIASVFKNFSNVTLLNIDPKNRHYQEMKEYEIIDVKLNKRSKILNLINLYTKIIQIVRTKNIEIIFTNGKDAMIISSLVKISLMKKHITLLSTSHNSYAWENSKEVKLYAKFISLFADGYISLSSHVSSLLAKNGVDSRRIFTTANPIEQKTFKVKSNYTFLKKVPTIVYVGVIYKGKGQDILTKSINELKKEGITVNLDFFGDIIDDAFYKENIEYIKTHGLEGNIIFRGQIDNSKLRELLSYYDIYACPSEMEMSPYNVIEAKAAGLPIIATNVGGIPDIISNNVNGILVEPKDVMSLSEAIHLLIDNKDLREKLGKAAFLSSEEKHAPEHIAEKLNIFISNLKK